MRNQHARQRPPTYLDVEAAVRNNFEEDELPDPAPVGGARMTSREQMDALRRKQRSLLRQLAVFSDALRGSEPYMMERKKELMALASSASMLAVDVMPLIFNTVAPADMHQTYLFRSILSRDPQVVNATTDAARVRVLYRLEKELDVRSRFDLLAKNPTLATRHFWVVVQELLRLLRSPGKPLGDIMDIWCALTNNTYIVISNPHKINVRAQYRDTD